VIHDSAHNWTPYPHGMPECACGERGPSRQRAKYHMPECARWPWLMEREGRDEELRARLK